MNTHPARIHELVTTLNLHRHPEGGWYSEVHRSSSRVTPVADGRNQRSALTAIYFLLELDHFSAWHKVLSDEVWIYLEGNPLDLWTWNASNNIAKCVNLGPVNAHIRPQHTVPAGIWQAAKPQAEQHGAAYTLVACTVGPGFEFDDFEMMKPAGADAARLAHSWPQLAAFIPV